MAVNEAALVTVGIPTHNRADGLKRTLHSITSQTYLNLDIVVSDNASTDQRVSRILSNAAERDGRIRYFSQQKNIGAGENFLFVLRHAKGSYFMWAADDDYWEPTFIERLLCRIRKDPKCGFAFCDFDVRYDDGTLCCGYGSFLEAFEHFTCGTGHTRVANYALQAPERGKANMIYGLYRVKALDQAIAERYFRSRIWGADMLFVCNILSRWKFGLVADKLYTVGISDPKHEQKLDHSAHSSCNTVETKLRLVVSHLQYCIEYIRIIAGASESNPAVVLWFSLRIIPHFWKFVKSDLR
jgi:glycosyltransferase involved in cell wall biosynthesis